MKKSKKNLKQKEKGKQNKSVVFKIMKFFEQVQDPELEIRDKL